MTLAVVVIALLVLLVIVDGSEAAGAHRGEPQDAEAFQADASKKQPSASACFLNVTSVFSRRPQEQRKQSRKPAREEQVETTLR
jgi:hypothetical protein